MKCDLCDTEKEEVKRVRIIRKHGQLEANLCPECLTKLHLNAAKSGLSTTFKILSGGTIDE